MIKLRVFFAIGLLCVSTATPIAAQKQEAVEEIEINKRPLVDFSQEAAEAVASGVDLNAAFLVELTGQINKDGKFDRKTSRFTRTEGDKRLSDLAKKAIESINDAGYFRYLESLSIKDLKISVSQDSQNSMWELTSAFENENRAKSRSATFLLLLQAALLHMKDKALLTDDEKDDLTLLRSVSVVAEGKKLTVRSVLPKPVFIDMIKRRIPTKSQSSE